MSMLDEIGAYLQTKSHGTTGTNIFAEILPPTPDVVTIIRELTPRKPERVMGKVSFFQPTLQVIVRDTTLSACATRAWAIWTDLDGFSGTMGSTRYLFIETISHPRPVGLDENERHMMTMSFHIKKEKS